jgi:cytochrome c553
MRMLGCVALAGAWSLPAHAASAQTLVTRGTGQSAPACQACHGVTGGGQAAFPRLAGLNAAYLNKQLDDYAQGTRANAVMQPIAQALSAGERHAVATYYSRQPVPAPAPTARPAADGVGATLATRGRWSVRVPACEQCHGPGGVGVGAHFPPLAGQPAAYIEAQLKAWQRGSRRNDPLDLMGRLSRALNAQDIAAVAQWFAAQPMPAGSTPP